MRVALITDGVYPYVIGGMQKHSWFLTRFLLKNDIKVDLYHFRKYNLDKEVEDVFPGFGSSLTVTEIPFPEPGKLPFHYIRESKRYSEELYKAYCRNQKADFIICKGLTACAFIKGKMAGDQLPPVSVNFHGYEMFQKAFTVKDKLVQQAFAKPVSFVSRNADFVFSYGGGITDILKNKLNIPSQKILEYPAGVESEALANNAEPCAGNKRFVFVGRNERRKGIRELNAVLKRYIDAGNKNWTFDFVGEVPDELMLNACNIHYHGLITEFEKIRAVLRKSDVLVCPSWSEGMPNVILEAMSQGLAVLATDTGATRLLVNEKTGWLIAEPTQTLLITAFENVLAASAAEVFQKKKNALAHVKENFLWEDIGRDLSERIRLLSLN